MKKLIFVTQAKGGSGKSVLTFLLAELYKDAVIFDMDDATKTTTLQLAYRKPIAASFLNESNIIDRGIISAFFEKVASAKANHIICDLGASISEQLPFYLSDIGGAGLGAILEDLKIDLQIYTVVGGSNIFSQTMNFLTDVNKAVEGGIKVRVFKNEYYGFTNDQNNSLKDYTALANNSVISYNISKDTNESTKNRIMEVLKSGKGVDEANVFSKIYFTKALKELEESINALEETTVAE